MQILTVDNQFYSLVDMPEEIDDIRYSIIDFKDPEFIDYYFKPLVFLEIFSSPAIELKIGEYKISMPLEWNVIVGYSGGGILEFLPLIDLNNRGFETLLYNPLKGYRPHWRPIDIINVYTEVKWYFPKLEQCQALMVPLEKKENPLCAYFARDLTKIPVDIDVGDLII